MNPENVPPWGCPWHGLVKGGRVYLPNGTSRPYPQPSNTLHNMSGNTSLVARPGVPLVDRTEEEQAADAAAGRQWWNVAVRAGDRLHGREVPAGNWIYIDPAGDRWLVSLNLNGAIGGGAANMTLRRFGVLGGAPIEYVYSVTVPDMEQAVPAITGSDGTLNVLRHHSNPTGSASVFEVSVGFGAPLPGQPDPNRYWPRRPCGWVEVRLSGAGSECEIAVEVLKTRSQTLGSAYLNDFPAESEAYFLVEEWDGDVLIGTRLTNAPPAAGSNSYLIVYHDISESARLSAGFDDYVIGMWYDNAGQRHELSAYRHVEMTFDSPPLVYEGETWFPVNETITGVFSCTQQTTLAMRFGYRVDGASIHEVEYEASEAADYTLTMSGVWDVSRTGNVFVAFMPGAEIEHTYSTGLEPRPPTGASLGGSWFISQPGIGPDVGGVPALLSLNYRWGFTPTTGGQLPPPVEFVFYRYSNQLYGLMNWHLPESGPPFLYRYNYLPEVVTPHGLGALPEMDLTQSLSVAFNQFELLAYGSWCPVTAAAARDTEPVCFT